ncbi:MAG: sulfotransferase family 2 domain-containing protein [Candidatus Staskawiczbacteria bacterium]|nr:sulfotransferase family 2 domain-containing protein [Candidatus Staskawiczbacteria bacterium]
MNDFLFIHVNKTGGSSIEKVLNLETRHITALEYKEKLGEDIFNSLFKFSFVRNPWDRVVSLYHYRVMTNQTGLKDNPIPFNEWVELTFKLKDKRYYDKEKMFMPQVRWLSDGEKIIVDFICRFENIEKDFDYVCKKLKISNAVLPHLKKSERLKDYRVYYNEKSKEIVGDFFKDDIKLFNYKF